MFKSRLLTIWHLSWFMDGRLKVIEHLNQTLFFFDIAYEKSLDAELELLNRWKESRGLLISSRRHSEVTEILEIITSTCVPLLFSVEYLQIFIYGIWLGSNLNMDRCWHTEHQTEHGPWPSFCLHQTCFERVQTSNDKNRRWIEYQT